MLPILRMIRLLFVLSLTLWSAASPAQDIVKDSPIIATLKALYAGGKYEEAYKFGILQLELMEGIPDFDFYFGLSALQSGHYPDARFVFERLVALYPNQDRFRLEYARTLFQLNQYDMARDQFQQVLTKQPPQTVTENINQFLTAIDERQQQSKRRWSGSVDIGGGYDNNINNATDDRFVGLFELPDSALQAESPFASLRTNLNYSYPVDQLSSANLGFDSQSKHNLDQTDFDLDSMRLSAFWKTTEATRELQGGISYQHVLLDGEDYQRSSGLFGQWKEQWGEHLLSYVYTGVFIKDSFADDLLNNYFPLLSLTMLAPQGKLLHSLTLFAGTENPRTEGGASQAKQFQSVGYKISYQATAELVPYLSVSGFFSRYKAEHPVFEDTRKDESYQASTGGEWRINTRFSVLADLTYTENESNLSLYDYTRWKGETRVRWRY